MKTQRYILLAMLSIVVVSALFLMSQEIIGQTDEIVSLRQRVRNLEIIINYELITEGKLTTKS